MTSSIQQPFEVWYTNCENKHAHTQAPSGEEDHQCGRATHTHTHTLGWPPPTAACRDISKTRETQDNCYCQPSRTHGQQTRAGVCVCLTRCGWINSPVLWFKQNPCARSAFRSKVLQRQEVAQRAEMRLMWFRHKTQTHWLDSKPPAALSNICTRQT